MSIAEPKLIISQHLVATMDGSIEIDDAIIKLCRALGAEILYSMQAISLLVFTPQL